MLLMVVNDYAIGEEGEKLAEAFRFKCLLNRFKFWPAVYVLFFGTGIRFLWYHRCVAITSSAYYWATFGFNSKAFYKTLHPYDLLVFIFHVS